MGRTVVISEYDEDSYGIYDAETHELLSVEDSIADCMAECEMNGWDTEEGLFF